jgi:hypothetical protein
MAVRAHRGLPLIAWLSAVFGVFNRNPFSRLFLPTRFSRILFVGVRPTVRPDLPYQFERHARKPIVRIQISKISEEEVACGCVV